MFELVNKGIIPRDVDVSPAFDRGAPILQNSPSLIYDKPLEKPKHLTSNVSKVKLSSIKKIKPRINDNADIPYFNGTKFRVPDPDSEPDASFHRPATFLTNLDVTNRNLLNVDNYYEGSFDKESRKSKVS